MGRKHGGGGSAVKNRNIRENMPTIAKYIVLALIAGYVALLMMNVSGSRKPFEEISAAVSGVLDMEILTEQDAQALKRNFGLNSSDYEGVLYYASDSSMSAEEVLLILVTEDSQIRQVTDALEERVESRLGDFEGYAPEQVKILEDARQSVRGKYIFFAVSEDAQRYLEMFADSL